MSEELIPIIMFLCIAIVFCALFWFRYKSRQEMQQTFRSALDKGHELTPEIIDRLGHPKVSKDKDLRFGIMWLAFAVALAIAALAVPDDSGEALRGMLTGAAFPFTIGVAYLIMYKFTERG